MMESPISKKIIFLTFIFSFLVCLLIFINNYFDDRTKIVFCDVGQGDAAYIRIRNKIDVLIDAGPDRKVLNCLGKHMPFWDRKVELIFISHNQKDHFGGVDYILDRYQVDTIYLVNDLNASLQLFKQLKEKIVNKKVKIEAELAGKIIKFMNDKITIMWPTEGLNSNNDNDFSSVLLFEENTFKVLFTGDASPFILDRVSHQVGAILESPLHNINILKVPHHGSKNGLNKNFLELAGPKVAVISVGKNNPYGHPVKAVLDMLKAKNIKIKRTDINGDIVFRLR